jgi:L-alanine-DL-glutamate epimerase-like enolase superfamily enzyme
MKITGVTLIPASYATDDTPPFRRSFAVLRLETDEGVTGWGEASDCYGHRYPLTLTALFEETVQWLLLGRDPVPLEDLMWNLRRTLYAPLGARGLVIQALSAVDIALWDIRGKLLGTSVSALLGRKRQTVPLYAAGKPALYEPPESNVEFFATLLDRGVTAAKVRTGRDFAWDRAMVERVRELLPDDIEMFVDGKYNYTPDSARRFARVLADIGVEIFEEPIPALDLDLVRRLGRASPVALAYGEHAFTVHDFRDLLIRAEVRHLEPDVTVCGGFTEGMKILHLAETHGARIVPHCGGLTAIGMAANLAFVSAYADPTYFEYDARPHQPLRDQVALGAPFALDKVVDGVLPIPAGPGLGIEVDEEVFSAYPYEIDTAIASRFSVYTTPHI